MFISIEGIDGSGKSTVTKLLAKKLKGVAISTPPDVMKSIRSKVDDHQSRKAKYYFYISGLYLLDGSLRQLMKENHVICDRHIHSTLAYQFPDDELFPTNIHNLFPDLQKPEKTIFLTADQTIRKKRILSRENGGAKKNPADYNYEAQELALSRFEMMSDLIKIDTTNHTALEVCNEICKILHIGNGFI
jgi:thymidylate kinase